MLGVVVALCNGIVYHVLGLNEFMRNFLVLRSLALEVVFGGDVIVALVSPFRVPITR